MGKCHGKTFVRWIVKHLVSYMAAAEQDNRLISWLSEPYRTISLFLTLIPFSPDTRLRLVHTFTVHSINTYSVNTQKKMQHLCTLKLYSDSFLNRENQEQSTNSRQVYGYKIFGNSFINLFQLKRSRSLPERTYQQHTLQKIPLKGHNFLFLLALLSREHLLALLYIIIIIS